VDRTTITRMSEDEYGQPRRKVVGWFDLDAAEKFAERTQAFDGANLAGVHLRNQNAGQVLYRTAGDRWVLMNWSRWQGSVDTWEYIGVADAREWLIVNEESDETLERLFGAPPEPERGPGRPEIGSKVEVRMPDEWIDRLDQYALERGESRARTIRRAVIHLLAATPQGAPRNDFPPD
jgi:hypothetical protein